VDVGLLATAKALRRAYDTALGSKLDITLNEANLLAQLAGRRSLTQVELARRLGVSRARVGVHIDSLEARGAVKRVADRTDRRVWKVSLTARGRSILTQSTDVNGAVRARVHQGLTDDDLTVLDRLLVVIRENLGVSFDDIGRSDPRR
jgi:MarR family transcriptional regulator for hemolysin